MARRLTSLTLACASWLGCAWLATTPGTAAAAMFLETSVEQVARGSEAVVRGRVERQVSSWTADGRRIETEVTIAVAESWKGGLAGRVKVIVPGGKVGDLAQSVDAAPTFEHGEDVVVFLSHRGPAWAVSGLALGKYRVTGGRAVPGVGEASFTGPAVRAGERRVGEMGLEELRGRVAAGAAR